MELKVDIGFEQLVQAIKKLPEGKLMQLKAELEDNSTQSKPKTDFQKLLLEGPVMTPSEYKEFKNVRNRINRWRTK